MQQSGQDRFNLKRFINAQNKCYATVRKELTKGKKLSHWMWFIFPQIDGLARSPTAKKYAIKSLEEATAYLNDPILGKRLIECTRLVICIENSSAQKIFSFPDYLKFHSSMTLFASTEKSPDIFKNALLKFYGGLVDKRSVDILNKSDKDNLTAL
ncbi:DUF1810 domain-containing protein [Psychromonas sp. MB-3u-54]|uniref:DUF1810 domain-containing protein n=1 Tax=Psychromonas sp. MB-3u-54 TaxID=2058319 RepID=UPI000C34341D|nr:DUF1810 domain-containing protein [Psychromonas sp. MB-3u-54]PKH02668.1 DUF1810 domain-containing protein [Psychromonas sp. MB-3u-54]